MIFPRGEAVHKNLSTAYTDIPALLDTLKLGGFSGTIEIDYPEMKGFFFVDSGEVVNGEIRKEGNSGRVIGQEAVRALRSFSKQKDGILSVYRLAPEQVAIIASNLHHEILFKGLSTHFVHLDRFLLKLKEEHLTGFIEVMDREDFPMGVLFIEGGEPMEMFTTPKAGPSTFGRISIPIFVERATRQGAFFNVYGKKEEPPRHQEDLREDELLLAGEERGPGKSGKGFEDRLILLQEFLSGAERLVDGLFSEGAFRTAFKKASIDKAEEFDFLDPFAGEFEYMNGTISFTGEVDGEAFVKGVTECFRTVLSHLEATSEQEKMVSLKLKAGIESFIENHEERLKRLRAKEIFLSLLK